VFAAARREQTERSWVPTVSLTLARFTEDDRSDWLASALPVLSRAEQEHVGTMLDSDARTRHAIGRAMLRLTAAEASGRRREQLVITVSELGKPLLADMPDLHVSVAHTARAVVTAVCSGAAVGVDIEPALPTVPHPRRLAERLFAKAEVASLRDMPDAAIADWFSSAWIIKEAVGKALGVGMVPAFSGAVVESRAEGVALASVWIGPPADSWTVHQLTAPDGTEKIAVALPAPAIRLEPVSQLTLEAFSRRLPPD
jgi:phosphopantetheinyl transferase